MVNYEETDAPGSAMVVQRCDGEIYQVIDYYYYYAIHSLPQHNLFGELGDLGYLFMNGLYILL